VDSPVHPTQELTLAQQSRLVDALQASLQARWAPQAVTRHETHISWVLVTPERAYKLKKAIAPGFLDYSTLARRRHFCDEEVRLNRRLAPTLYLGVLPVGGSIDAPALGGSGTAIDHVVHMRAFAQESLWDHLARTGQIQAAWVDELAALIQRFHAAAPSALPESRFGSPQQVRAPMLDTLAALERLAHEPEDQQRLAELRRWEAISFARLAGVFARRRDEGRVRECHGDLHLRNIAQIDGHTTVFDGIEFSDDLRWIDTASEIAFLVMDLQAHGLPALANRFLDAWLQHGSDVDALHVLGYYTAYRALVRAKVAALRAAQPEADPADAAALHAGIAQAHADTRPRPRALMIAHGLAGSGKTTLTQSLLEATGAIRVRADVVRKRLAGLDLKAHTGSPPGAGLYTEAATAATYTRLCELAAQGLAAGRAIVIDATFLRQAQRAQASRVAAAAGVPFMILDVDADLATLRARIVRRRAEGRDASEADLAVLEAQCRQREPLTAQELTLTWHFDTAASDQSVPDWTALRQRWMLAGED
jgi:uncharacterized protein